MVNVHKLLDGAAEKEQNALSAFVLLTLSAVSYLLDTYPPLAIIGRDVLSLGSKSNFRS